MQGLPEVGDLSTEFEWTFDEARSKKIADALKKDSDHMAARFEQAAKEQHKCKMTKRSTQICRASRTQKS